MGAGLLPLLLLGKQVVGWVIDQAALLQAEGGISDEEYAAIRTAADMEDAEFDSRVAAARARLAAGGGE